MPILDELQQGLSSAWDTVKKEVSNVNLGPASAEAAMNYQRFFNDLNPSRVAKNLPTLTNEGKGNIATIYEGVKHLLHPVPILNPIMNWMFNLFICKYIRILLNCFC